MFAEGLLVFRSEGKRALFSGRDYDESAVVVQRVGLWYLVISLIDHSTMSDSDLEGYFQGVWIFILPLFLLFFGLGYF